MTATSHETLARLRKAKAIANVLLQCGLDDLDLLAESGSSLWVDAAKAAKGSDIASEPSDNTKALVIELLRDRVGAA